MYLFLKPIFKIAEKMDIFEAIAENSPHSVKIHVVFGIEDGNHNFLIPFYEFATKIMDKLCENDQEFVIHLINRNMRYGNNTHLFGCYRHLVSRLWTIMIVAMFGNNIPENILNKRPRYIEMKFLTPRPQQQG